jgi:hypothetical protein
VAGGYPVRGSAPQVVVAFAAVLWWRWSHRRRSGRWPGPRQSQSPRRSSINSSALIVVAALPRIRCTRLRPWLSPPPVWPESSSLGAARSGAETGTGVLTVRIHDMLLRLGKCLYESIAPAFGFAQNAAGSVCSPLWGHGWPARFRHTACWRASFGRVYVPFGRGIQVDPVAGLDVAVMGREHRLGRGVADVGLSG